MSSEVALEMQGDRWKRYSAYRDSGDEWLGEVPKVWETWKVTHGFQKLGSGTTPKSDDPQYYNDIIPWVTTSELRETVITDTKSKLSEKAMIDYSSLRIYPPETLLFAMYGATIGRMGILGIPATVNQACCAFTGSKFLDSKFTFYWLWMRRPILIAFSVGGGQPNLSQDDLRKIRIPAPSIPEQRTIAAFLDRETGRIDTLIEKKERQVELLQEKRAALISHTVTKGLDPDVKMKDSGVEWLGEVPEHWNIERLKYCVTLINEKVDGRESILPYTGLENIESWTGRLILREEVSTSEGQSNRFEIGDVLFGKLRPYLAKVLRAKEHGICTGELLVFRPKDVSQDYIFRYMLARDFISIVDSSTYGAKMPRASWDFIGDIPVLLPIEAEQRAIAAFLDHETGRIDTLEKKVRESIEKLSEYRTAFISAAVTGKIDVRKEESHEQC